MTINLVVIRSYTSHIIVTSTISFQLQIILTELLGASGKCQKEITKDSIRHPYPLPLWIRSGTIAREVTIVEIQW